MSSLREPIDVRSTAIAYKEKPLFAPKGKFGWYDLMTTDTKAARQ